jgi:hypothetical protein
VPPPDKKEITNFLLMLFTGIVAYILFHTGGGMGFMLAPMACDAYACKSILSNLAVLMLMLFPIELIISLVFGWKWYYSQQYNKSLMVTWGLSIAWMCFVLLSFGVG